MNNNKQEHIINTRWPGREARYAIQVDFDLGVDHSRATVAVTTATSSTPTPNRLSQLVDTN